MVLTVVLQHLNATIHHPKALVRVRLGDHTLEETNDHLLDASNLLHRVKIDHIGVDGKLRVDQLGVEAVEVHHVVLYIGYFNRVQKWPK